MPKIVDHDLYRKELLSKCFTLFAQKGYAALTMRQIAQDLGVSTGTLYHYFPSKEALFEQLVEEQLQQTILQITDEIDPNQSPIERLFTALEFILSKADCHSQRALIWIEFYQQQGAEKIHQSKTAAKAWQKGAKALAEVVGISDPKLYTFLICWLDGLFINRLFDPELISLQEQLKLLKTMLQEYLYRNNGEDSCLESSYISA